MAYRKISTWTLLTFVVFTAGYAAGKEVGVRRALARMPRPDPSPVVVSSEGSDPAHALVAWYFHSTKRCRKCNTIEAYAREAMDTLFPVHVANGSITWQTANMDDIWNEDTVRRFGLVRSSLVLVDMLGGEEKGFVVLNRTWDLTADKEAFLAYVELEVNTIVDGWTAGDPDSDSDGDPDSDPDNDPDSDSDSDSDNEAEE